eukprot:TRINITY_DN18810_c0_g1_i1.p1 TRINITY_DN18810_c0_g1~~TRINITY_DN18810_c0_g1_i1.p1  ORF type:complete len:528 (-),score=62.54 TRINITY_DN18810_c0_g1_i1:189-1772(-)
MASPAARWPFSLIRKSTKSPPPLEPPPPPPPHLCDFDALDDDPINMPDALPKGTKLPDPLPADEIVKMSKRLSWVLRRGARQAGVKMDRDGWVPLSSLLECQYFTCLTASQFVGIVRAANETKDRFEQWAGPASNGEPHFRATRRDNNGKPKVSVPQCERENQKRLGLIGNSTPSASAVASTSSSTGLGSSNSTDTDSGSGGKSHPEWSAQDAHPLLVALRAQQSWMAGTSESMYGTECTPVCQNVAGFTDFAPPPQPSSRGMAMTVTSSAGQLAGTTPARANVATRGDAATRCGQWTVPPSKYAYDSTYHAMASHQAMQYASAAQNVARWPNSYLANMNGDRRGLNADAREFSLSTAPPRQKKVGATAAEATAEEVPAEVSYVEAEIEVRVDCCVRSVCGGNSRADAAASEAPAARVFRPPPGLTLEREASSDSGAAAAPAAPEAQAALAASARGTAEEPRASSRRAAVALGDEELLRRVFDVLQDSGIQREEVVSMKINKARSLCRVQLRLVSGGLEAGSRRPAI